MHQLLTLTITSILIGLISTPRETKLSDIILNASLSFYITLLVIIQTAGYLDLFYRCGISGIITAGTVLVFALSTILFFHNRSWTKKIELPDFNIRKKEWIIYAPIGVFYLVLFLVHLVFYPDSYDGNAYHLPLAIKFLQSDSFSKLPRIWHYAMPANAESIFTIFSFARNPVLLNFSQLFLLIALILWSYRFNRFYFGFSNQSSRICTVLLLSMPVVFQGTFFHYIDFFGSTFLYFSITTALSIQKTRRKKLVTALFFCGLFYGIALGTKLTFIVFSPILCGLILYALYTKRKEFGLRDTLSALASCTIAVFLLSLFWYIRNCILFENPLFPLNVPHLNWFGVPIESIVSSSYDFRFTGGTPAGWFLFPISELHPTGEYYFSFGPLFGVYIFPACIITSVLTYVKFFRKEPSFPPLLTLTVICTIAIWYFFLSRQPRFIMIAPLLMITCAGYAYEYITTRKLLIHSTIFTFSLMLLLFYPVQYLSKSASCVNYRYTPYEWDAYYKIPVSNTTIEKRGVLNLNLETMNFALYGPSFRNRVITTQEVQNTLYGEKLSYLEAQNLPPFSNQQIDSLYRVYGDVFFYSSSPINNRNLNLVSKGVDRFPRIRWLNSCIYTYQKTDAQNPGNNTAEATQK